MSNDAYLVVGDVQFEFRYEVPAYVVLLFDPGGYFEESDDEESPEAGDPEVIGYKTSVAGAIDHLDAVGLGIDRLVELYRTYKADLLASYLALLEYALLTRDKDATPEDVQAGMAAHVGEFAASDPAADVMEFGHYLSVMVKDGKLDSLGRPGELSDQIREAIFSLPPAVFTVAGLFDQEQAYQYEELAFLLYVRTLMVALNRDAQVRLEVQEVVDWDRVEGRQIYKAAIEQLAKKVDLYNRLLGPVVDRGSAVQRAAGRDALRAALDGARRAIDKDEKGRSLEAAAQALFGLDAGFKVKQVRLLLGDEEIDLTVVNDRTSGFWSNLQSPLILVECKNWSTDVGAKEIRDFEGKLRNHRGLARVGILIAGNEYSSEAHEMIKRLSRDETTIVLLKTADIEAFCATDQDLASWLEDHIAQLA